MIGRWLGPSRDEGERWVTRAELMLARDDRWPLREVPFEPDPLTGMARAFAGLRDDLREEATVALDLVPLTRGQQNRRRSRLSRQIAREETDGSGGRTSAGLFGWDQLVSELTGKRPTSRGRSQQQVSTVARVDRRDRDRTMSVVMRDPAPHFQVQVLVRVRSEVAGRAEGHLQAIIAAFEPFGSTEQWWRVAGQRVGGLFVGSDVAWRRRQFDQRLDGHVWRSRPHNVVSTTEIAGLLKPPTRHCDAPGVIRSGGVVPPPPRTLPTFTGDANQMPWGEVDFEDGRRVVAVNLDDTYFTGTFGRSRFGKTEAALSRFVHLARSGHGCLFLDPHADALERVKPYLAPVADRVVELSIARGSGKDRQVGWNLFSMEGCTAADIEDRAAVVVDSFAAAMRWSEINNRALTITQQTTVSLLELALQLPPELAPTIFQIPTMLADEQWRTAVLPHLSRSLREYWTDRFPRLGAEAITPITNVVDRMRMSPSIAGLLGQSRSTYSLRRAMDLGQVVLIRLRGTSEIDQLLASFFIYDLLSATLSRWDLPPDRRRPMHAFLDEVQSYDSSVRGLISAALEEGAKYGLRMHLLNQQPTRLSPQTLQALLTNRSHLASTNVGYDSARLLEREWSGNVTAETVMGLDKYQFVTQVTSRGELTTPFRARGLSLPGLFGPPDVAALSELEDRIDANSGRQPVGDVLDRLAELDSLILDELEQNRRKVVPISDGPANRTPSPFGPGPVRRFDYGGPT